MPRVALGLREHVSSPHCWCEPELDEDGIYQHRKVDMSEKFGRREAQRGMTSDRETDHLRTIEERWAYLSQRIIAKENVGWDTKYDRDERDALDWVLFKLSGSDRDRADVKNAAVEGADAG